MNVQPLTYNEYYPNFQGNPSSKNFIDRVLQHVMDKLPEFTLKESNAIKNSLERVDTFLAKPAQNRLVMGGTAILTQPIIDYHNPNVDDETKTIAKNRTVAKIIAGTTVGAIVRGLTYKAIECMTQIDGTGKLSKKLLPKSYIKEFIEFAKKLNNHRNAVSTFAALGVMLITNFLLDAPITRWLTNKFNANDKKLKSIQQAKQLQELQQIQQAQIAQEGRFIAYA